MIVNGQAFNVNAVLVTLRGPKWALISYDIYSNDTANGFLCRSA